MRQKIIVIFILFIISPIYADESALLSGQYIYNESSDNMFMHSSILQFRSHRRDTLNLYEDEASEDWDYSGSFLATQGFNSKENYNGQRVLFLGGKKFSPNLHMDISGGAHNLYDTANQNSASIFVGEIKTYFVAAEFFNGFMSFNRDYAYIHTIQPGGIDYRLTATSLNSSFSINFTDYLTTRFIENYFFISDQNQKSVTNVSLLYGIAKDIPWIWVGIGYENTSYKYLTTDYWSPSAFMSFGTRAEADLPLLFIDNLNLGLEFNYNRLWDKDTCSDGNGVSFSGKLTYGDRNFNNISIYYSRINSIQNGNLWFSNEAGLTINIMM